MMRYSRGRKFWSDKITDLTNNFLCDYPGCDSGDYLFIINNIQ